MLIQREVESKENKLKQIAFININCLMEVKMTV